ncbi:LOW QUALITY PROTEIN: keratin, type I cytoskeletal 18 [Falco peregrinus]|uniref:LOW QUALITY PROTEIN: keratin, type I cytoskeletal 18 n=1 Tax=Falco peregrinus TaxID=8954 RepID=UPI0024796868|nr:LOW QUALITY PROTEIN: keratin, type I cytoskeletal 18 [Falco peregrinus]
MSFSHRSTYSGSHRATSHRFGPLGSAASVYAGAGGSGSRISVTRTTSVTSAGGGYGAGYGPAMGATTMLTGSGVVANEKETMQDLNERLATYLEKVRSLEQDNRRLEVQIREFMASKGPSTQDWGHHWEAIEDLRDKIFKATVANARTVLQMDNARLAADDFRVKYEAELAIRLSVENDIAGLRKVLDDTNMARLQLEGEIESLREELIFMKKNHEEEVKTLRAQVSESALTVEVDAPKSQDLGKVMAEIRAQYDALAQKNLEDLEKQWGRQITESTIEITQSTKDIDAARSTVVDLRRSVQTLEIDLESLRNQKAGLEANLAEVETRYAAQLEQLGALVLRAEAELLQLRQELQRQAQEYQALRDVKGKLEDEIATYHRLLEGGGGFQPAGRPGEGDNGHHAAEHPEGG